MKIGEYIELVKQAETPQNGRISTPPPFEGRVEPTNPGPPPVIRKVPVESIPFVSPANSEANIAKETPVTDNGRLPATPVRDRATGMLRMPYTAEDYGVHFGRLDGTKGIFSKINPNLAFLEGTYIEPPFPLNSTPSLFERKSLSPRGFISSPTRTVTPTSARLARLGANALKAVGNTPAELINPVNAPVRFIDTSRLGAAFSLLAPTREAKRRAEDKASDSLRKNGVNPSDNIKLPFRYEVSPDAGAYPSYYGNLLLEYAKESPQALPTWASFSSPLAPVAIASDLGINMPYSLFTGSSDDLLPGFWHSTGRTSRYRSNQDYEDEENDMSRLGKLLPDILRTDDKLYGFGNLLADSAGGYVDPVFQWPFGLLYGHNMHNLADLMGKPNAVRTDEYGKTTVDYRDLFSNIFGSKGVYEQEGGRPTLRNLTDEQIDGRLNTLREAAARNGYTKDEIDRYTLLYANPNALKYAETNGLKFMGMPAKDIYNSMYMGELPSSPSEDIPRYNRTSQNSVIGGVTEKKEDNPKWLEENKRIQRRLADQETLFNLNPFFKAIRGSASQLSPEEESFLSKPDNLSTLDTLPIEGLIRPVTPDDVPSVGYINNAKEALENRAFKLLPYILQKINSENIEDPEEVADAITRFALSSNIEDPEKFTGVVANLMRKQTEGENVLAIPAHPVGLLGDPDESLITGWNDANKKYNKIDKEYSKSYNLNRIARLPYQYRYAVLKDNPQYIEPFLERYYTNEETKNRIRKFLNVPTPEEISVAKPSGTLMSMLVPSLLKARQQIAEQQRLNTSK